MASTKKIYDVDLEEAKEKVSGATDTLDAMNYDSFKQGSIYDGLKKSYEQQGRQAMKDTIGQVAARTGGMASSYATTAAQQSYNNYMSQLEDVARSMYNDEYSKARDKVTLAQGEYDRAYGEHRDQISDDRYNTEWQYQLDRDKISDDRYNAEKDESRTQEAREQAQADVIAIWATGGTPTAEQLAAAGWGDEEAVASEDGAIPAGLSALGQAYYKKATAAPADETTPEPVDREDFEYYSKYMSTAKSQKDAAYICAQIATVTGNQDFADLLYEQWLGKAYHPDAGGFFGGYSGSNTPTQLD